MIITANNFQNEKKVLFVIINPIIVKSEQMAVRSVT
jgi:hypothetical protein